MAQDSTPTQETQNITIQGMLMRVPKPYKAGHKLNDNEAAALNQTFAENLRNNFAQKIRQEKEQRARDKKGNGQEPTDEEIAAIELSPNEMQPKLDEYAVGYTFGERGGKTVDPVERAMREIARRKVSDVLKAQGTKLNSVPAEKWEELITDYVKRAEASPAKKLRKAAEDQVKMYQKIALADLSG